MRYFWCQAQRALTIRSYQILRCILPGTTRPFFETDPPEFFANYQACTRVIPLPRGRRTKEELAAERAKAGARAKTENGTEAASKTSGEEAANAEAEESAEATSEEVKAVLAEDALGTRVNSEAGAELAS